MATSHQYEVHSFFGPHHCDVCNGFLWGLRKQGFRCQECQGQLCKTCHKDRALATAVCPVLEKQQQQLREMSSEMLTRSKQEQVERADSKKELGQSDEVDTAEVYDWYCKYVKRDASGKLVVKDLPRDWRDMFKEAGVKPSELKNPDTAIMLIKAMKEFLKGVAPTVAEAAEAVAGEEAAAAAAEAEAAADQLIHVLYRAVALYSFEAQSEHDISFHKGDIVDVVQAPDGGWFVGRAVGVGYREASFRDGHRLSEVGTFPGNYVAALPEAPKEAPPPPPSHESTVDVSKSGESIADADVPQDEEVPAGGAGEAAAAGEGEGAGAGADSAGSVTQEAAEEAAANGSVADSEGSQAVPNGVEAQGQEEEKKAASAVPMPPPPPPMAEKKGNVMGNLKKVATPLPERKEGSGDVSDLLASIRKGKNLQSVEKRKKEDGDIGNLTEGQRTDLLSIMKGVMDKRRVSLEDSRDCEEDEDDWWDDDDS